MNSRTSQICRLLIISLLCVVTSRTSYATPWFPYGPDGGDARSIAPDPKDHAHLYLGTTTGWLYESHDGGKTWSHGQNRVGQRDDLVLESISVDPVDSKHLVIGAYTPGFKDGGIYISHDGGATWTTNSEMKGQVVLSMAMAPSNSRTLTIGTISGVYRSFDGGEHWRLISPAGSDQIHNIESLAVDPKHPDTIYAGTWHLPWKTTDGGANWASIKEGIIDDSDVFSIILDPKQPSTVYLSACSGIYKSENAGSNFKKQQGIPGEARRTRKLGQDPAHLQTVFAGTTQGLYRTMDGGAQWQLLSDPSLIVNDVYVDPLNSKHVLLATDRSGVLASDDGGQNFHASNTGFSARQILAMVSDPHHSATLYVGVVNDKDSGGVFLSYDGGLQWTQYSVGLNGSDVRSLVAAPDGTILAGTEHGIFRLDAGVWSLSSGFENAPVIKGSEPTANLSKRMTPAARKRALALAAAQKNRKTASRVSGTVNDTVYAMASTGNSVFAATSSSLLVSANAGMTWKPIKGVTPGEWNYVAATGNHVIAAQLRKLEISADAGVTWTSTAIPADLTLASAVAVDASGTAWVGGREGLFFSTDSGTSWHTLKELSGNLVNDIHDLYYDASTNSILVTGNRASTYGYAIHLTDEKVTPLDAGWNLRMMRPMGDHLVAATLYDGVVIQPSMVDSPVSTKW